MDIVISNTSGIPIYQQILDQISAQIIKGEMHPGDSLPAIRTAAKELRISVITVKKAWEELERAGLIYSMVGKGCFVAELSGGDLSEKRNELFGRRMDKDFAYYKELGLSLEEIIKAIEARYR
ncbi:MAG: GntR family transcriptional regulator [Clostridia bacterium]|nr:GntR family transcriptional regulator [Clostridia bacterium]MBT7123220.1 GntR family transcriptional regulator [Clostridia bacterium]